MPKPSMSAVLHLVKAAINSFFQGKGLTVCKGLINKLFQAIKYFLNVLS